MVVVVVAFLMDVMVDLSLRVMQSIKNCRSCMEILQWACEKGRPWNYVVLDVMIKVVLDVMLDDVLDVLDVQVLVGYWVRSCN
jgi:hypothetical protein